MRKVVVSEFMEEDILRAGLAGFDILYDPALVDDPERLAREAADARGIIVRNRTRVTAALLDAAPNLKAVGRLGVGLDNIDMEACKARGVAVFPASGANDVSVAEYVIATAMVLLRGAYGATARMAAGEWPRNALSNGREMMGATLGLVGFGSIARETARRASAMGMTIQAFDPMLDEGSPTWDQPFGRVAKVPLETLLRTSDVVSLHVPLTADTRRMIDASALGSMQPHAILINAARGGVVDEAALAEALKAGRIGGAALDVFETEPLKAEEASRFAGVPNLILTPHIAGLSAEANVRVSQVTVDSVRRHLTGE